MGKVFGIGLERTGTTSLCGAMKLLGFSACHFPRTWQEIFGNDFSNDITVTCRYKALDREFPGSRFIMTTRAMEPWLDSCRRFYERYWTDVFFGGLAASKMLYGVETFEREAWLAGRQRHEADVAEYFRERPQDLLVMDIAGGDGWEKLRPFVEPLRPFPRENVFPPP